MSFVPRSAYTKCLDRCGKLHKKVDALEAEIAEAEQRGDPLAECRLRLAAVIEENEKLRQRCDTALKGLAEALDQEDDCGMCSFCGANELFDHVKHHEGCRYVSLRKLTGHYR